MSDFKAECTKFDFGWGSAPDLAGGAYSAPPDPLAGFKGPTSKGGKGRGRGEGKGGEGKERREGEENEPTPPKSWICPWNYIKIRRFFIEIWRFYDFGNKNCKFLKSKMADGRHFENRKIAISQ